MTHTRKLMSFALLWAFFLLGIVLMVQLGMPIWLTPLAGFLVGWFLVDIFE